MPNIRKIVAGGDESHLAWASAQERQIRRSLEGNKSTGRAGAFEPQAGGYRTKKFDMGDGTEIEIRVQPSVSDIILRGTDGDRYGVCQQNPVEYGALKLDRQLSGRINEEKQSLVWLDGVKPLKNVKGAELKKMHPKTSPYGSKIYTLKQPPTPLPVVPPAKDSDFINPETNEVDPIEKMRYEFPDHAALWDKKTIARFLTPSLATGKMRTLLQTIIGSKHLMDRLTPVYGRRRKLTKVLLDGLLELSTTYYLVRDGNGCYWLLGADKAFLLPFTPCANPILHELTTVSHTREREIELEVQLFGFLAAITIPASEKANQVENPEYIPDIGWMPCVWPEATGLYPFAYNWHFKYQSNEAVRVTQTFIETDPDLIETRLTVATIHTTPIPLGGVPSPPTVTSVTQEVAELSFYPGQTLWFVNQAFEHQYALVNPVPVWKDVACDAPVYAFYNDNDELLTARFKRQKQDLSRSTEVLSVFDADYGFGTSSSSNHRADFVSGFYTQGADTNVTAVGATRLDVYITGIERGTVGEPRSEIVTYSPPYMQIVAPVSSGPNGPYWEPGPGGFALVSSKGYMRQDCYTSNISETGATSHASILMFSLDESEAFYIGSSKRYDYTKTKSTTVWQNTAQAWSVNNHIGYVIYSDLGTPRYEPTTEEKRLEYTTDIHFITKKQTFRIDVPGYSAWRDSFSYEYVNAVHNTVWRRLFWPFHYGNDFENIVMYAASSVSGRVIYSTGFTTYANNGSEYPVTSYPVLFMGHA